MIQQEQFLELVNGKDNVIAMGDWNFRPDSEQYALTTTYLDDTWLLVWPDWTDDQGQNPEQSKIDHIFVTPGASVLDAVFVDNPVSDHPAVTATMGW
jgi:endonuclease/exonuclease/phosphatase family metal-dependent hydrolase